MIRDLLIEAFLWEVGFRGILVGGTFILYDSVNTGTAVLLGW